MLKRGRARMGEPIAGFPGVVIAIVRRYPPVPDSRCRPVKTMIDMEGIYCIHGISGRQAGETIILANLNFIIGCTRYRSPAKNGILT